MRARVFDLHEIHQLAPARSGDQGERRLLHHRGIDLPDAEGVEEIGPDRRETDRACVGARLLEEIEQQRVVRVAQARYPDGRAFEALHGPNRIRPLGRHRKREERQPAGRSEAADRRAVGHSLKRDIKRSAGVLDRASDQRLHGRVAAAGVDEFDVETLAGKVPARARHFVRHNAEQLAAEGQPHLCGLAHRLRAARADKDHSRDTEDSFQRRAPVEGDRGFSLIRRNADQVRIRRFTAAHGGPTVRGRG